MLALAALAGCGEDVAGRGGNLDGTPPTNTPADSSHVWSTLSDFEFTTHAGESLRLEDVRGRTAVFATLFTRCGGPCPKITRALRELSLEPASEELLLLAVSVDSEHDTPEVLREYAARFDVDLERVVFLTGEREPIHEWIRANLKLAAGADGEPGHAVSHDRRLTVVDAEGRVRGWYDHERDAELLRERLAHLEAERAD